MKRIQGTKILRRLNDLLVILFFISFIFDYRLGVGTITILMAANGILFYRLESGKWWNPSFFNLFIAGLILYFAVQSAALLYTKNIHQGLALFVRNLGMIVLPVGVSYSGLVNRQSYGRLMKAYIFILFSATVIAIGYATVNFLRHHNASVFFYHPLVRIYSNHAIQFSVIVFTGILFLAEEYSRLLFFKNKTGIIFLLVYFSVFLFLLSSKLVIIIYFLYILYEIVFTGLFIRRRIYRIAGVVVLLVMITGVFITDSPFRERMKEEADARISMIRQQKFHPADYFTGIQFRLLSWRFTYEILDEKNAWLTGVSPGDVQDVLNEKYARENMFIGGAPGNRTGYLGYHTHNQFLQAVLETGIFGLTFFIVICAGLVRLALRSGYRTLYVFVFLLLCNCFTDAPLKTQYGIVLFVFFPLFMYKGSGRGTLPANR